MPFNNLPKSSRSADSIRPWRRQWLLLFILLLSSFLMLTAQKRRNQRFDLLSAPGQTVLEPLQKVTITVLNQVKKIAQGYIFLVGQREENQQLKRRIEILDAEAITAREAIAANTRLKSLLQFKHHIMPQALPSEVIGQDAVNWVKTILLDKGSHHRVGLNYPVITPIGIVGSVIQVSGNSCRVQLIIDSNSGISGLIQRSRAVGIVVGHGSRNCTMEYLPRDSDVETGDVVLSSGLDEIYPKGLAIGKILTVDKTVTGLFQHVKVEPSVNFSTLEEVLILLTPQEPVSKMTKSNR